MSTTTDDRPSYTEANAVAVNLSCDECKATLAGDNVPDVLREMFEEQHRHA